MAGKMKGGKAGKAKAVTNKARTARLRAPLRPAACVRR
jgi:hypothetical protein